MSEGLVFQGGRDRKGSEVRGTSNFQGKVVQRRWWEGGIRKE